MLLLMLFVSFNSFPVKLKHLVEWTNDKHLDQSVLLKDKTKCLQWVLIR